MFRVFVNFSGGWENLIRRSYSFGGDFKLKKNKNLVMLNRFSKLKNFIFWYLLLKVRYIVFCKNVFELKFINLSFFVFKFIRIFLFLMFLCIILFLWMVIRVFIICCKNFWLVFLLRVFFLVIKLNKFCICFGFFIIIIK